MFTGRAKPIRIIGEPDNQSPDKWSSTVPRFWRRGGQMWINYTAAGVGILRTEPKKSVRLEGTIQGVAYIILFHSEYYTAKQSKRSDAAVLS
jgi:hypothetical protein